MNKVEEAVNDSTKEAMAFEQGNEHEIRFYLRQIQNAMNPELVEEPFIPRYIVTAVKLPTGAIEIAVNNQDIPEKIDYILNTYDYAMRHKADENVVMQNIMIV